MIDMRKTIVFLSIFFLSWGVIGAQVDQFYNQAFEAGKKLVQQKDYQAAIERLQVAEFGLMDVPKILEELYFYTALAYYKLDQLEDVRQTLKKLKAIAGTIDPGPYSFPSDIEKDLYKMLEALNYISSKLSPPKVKEPGKKVVKKKAVEKKPEVTATPPEEAPKLTGFDQVRELIVGKDVKEGARQLKKLKKKNRNDPRMALLEGLLSFYQEKYQDVIQQLLAIYNNLDGEYRDEASYYLVLSYYFEKNYGQALAYYQKIGESRNKKQLKTIYNKIVTGRQADIDQLAENFSIGELEKLVARYSGDQFLCESIFQRILELHKGDNSSIESVIYGCLRFPSAINGNFIASAAIYLENAGKAGTAVKIITKYLNNRPLDENDTEVYYQLGKLYLAMSAPDRALKEFNIVLKLKPGYKDVRKYIEEMKRNPKNRNKYRSDK